MKVDTGDCEIIRNVYVKNERNNIGVWFIYTCLGSSVAYLLYYLHGDLSSFYVYLKINIDTF